MATFGQKLKEAREEKGLQLEDVSRATRIRVCHLEALERDDFDAMPQDVFVRGFVRMYASCLEVDPDLLVAEYRRERDNQRPTWEEDSRDEVVQEMSRILEVPREVSAENSRRLLKFAGFAVVVLALAGVWWIGAGSRDEARLARAELGAGTPASIDAAQRPPAPNAGAAPVRNPPVKPAAQPRPVTSPLPDPPVEAAPRPEPKPVVTPASAPPVEAVPERTESEPVATPPTKLPVEELSEPEPEAPSPTELPVEELSEPEPEAPPPTELPVEERSQPKPAARPQAKPPIEERREPKPVATPPAKPEPRAPVPAETAVTPLGNQGPAATPEPDSRPRPTAGRLSVTEFGIGTGIENRRLVGEADRFVEGTKVWFWTRVVGGEPEETIRHVWKHEGHGSSWVPLTLGGEHWRTQSRKTLWEGSAGRWAVEAVDGDGRVLARREFVCVPEAPSRPL